MKRTILSFLFLLFSITAFSQAEKYPVFEACDSTDVSQLATCFKNQVKEKLYKNSKFRKT